MGWWAALAGSWLVLAGAIVVAGTTGVGQDIAASVMRFLLFYGGVFTLIFLTAAVGVGLVATDRVIVSPGGRILAQGVHRAVSFGAVSFLIVHIVTEVVAGRSQPIDSIVPFLDHGRRFYLGLGTVASDLLILVVATGIARARFATWHRRWAWRAIHVSAYGMWILGLVHGLLAGRSAKPYVDWSYGACVGLVAAALILRVVANARVRETAATAVTPPMPLASAGALTAAGPGPYQPGMLGHGGPMTGTGGPMLGPGGQAPVTGGQAYGPGGRAYGPGAYEPQYRRALPPAPEYSERPYMDHDDNSGVRWAG